VSKRSGETGGRGVDFSLKQQFIGFSRHPTLMLA
jgi:hypothetical protein